MGSEFYDEEVNRSYVYYHESVCNWNQYEKENLGHRDMDQGLRVLNALAEDLNSILCTHMADKTCI